MQILLVNVWVSEFRTSIVCVISHSSESIWVIKPSFCQNDPPMGESLWQKDSLITHILSELWLIKNTILHSMKFADSHVTSTYMIFNGPVIFWSLKLRSFEPLQHLYGWPSRNTGWSSIQVVSNWCWHCFVLSNFCRFQEIVL